MGGLMFQRSIACAAVLVALVACSSHSSAKKGQAVVTVGGQKVTASVAPTATSVDSEGSVLTDDGKFVAYPDGFTIRYVSAVDLHDNELGYQIPAADTLVKITLSLENKSDQAVPLDGNVYMDVQYGDARYDAEVQGYAGDTKTLMDPTPNQVAAGSTLQVYQTFSVPRDSLDSIRVTPTIGSDHYTPFTFTDVGKTISE